MAAGKHGSKDVTIQIDDAPGGTLRTVTSGVLTISGVKITSAQELSNALGTQWEETTPSGMRKGEPINFEGYWDTTLTTGSHVVFGTPDSDPQGATRTLTVGFGDSKTASMEGRLIDYEVLSNNGKLTRFKATYQPSGAVTWA